MKTKLLSSVILLTCLQTSAFAEQGDDNPTGVSGIYNGQITTAGNYDPHTGNAMRIIEDIVVPGGVGSYPLKWTRYFNSHTTYWNTGVACRWGFSYIDYSIDVTGDGVLWDGRVITDRDFGVEETLGSVFDPACNFGYGGNRSVLHLADGGQVVYGCGNNVPAQLIDPYGNVTNRERYERQVAIMLSELGIPSRRCPPFSQATRLA